MPLAYPAAYRAALAQLSKHNHWSTEHERERIEPPRSHH